MSGEQSTNKPAPPDDLPDVDLYCLQCGYNLRGLCGDPRRCPECGNLNPLGSTEIPESLIKRELQRMDMPILLMSLSLYASLIFGIIGMAMMRRKADRESGLMLTLVAAAALGFLAWCAREFRSDCGSQPGWKGLAVGYILFIPLPIVLSAFLAGAATRLLEYALPGRLPHWVVTVTGLVILLGGLGIWSLLFRLLDKRREKLQRDIATVRARKHLRHRLTRPPRRGVLKRWLFGA